MKRNLYFLGLLSAIAVSCTVNEIGLLEEELTFHQVPDIVYATIDDNAKGLDTRVYSDGNHHVLWNADDRITYFYQSTYGLEYRFTGEDGDKGGNFKSVVTDPITVPDDLDMVYAVYPHNSNTTISTEGVITFTLPDRQTYYVNSFGKGANTMVSRTEDNILKFKNVGGYLSLKLYGNNVSVSSITLEGINEESLAGLCTIDFDADGLPVVTMDSNAENVSKKIRLDCTENPVELGSSDNPTEFCFVVPPMVFTDGFKITVRTPDGGVFQKTAPITNFEIKRNTIERMDPLMVVPTPAPSDLKINEIYTTRPTAKSQNYKYSAEYSESTETFTITIPTVTKFSELVLNYDLKDGDKLLYDGKEVESGVTPIDASGEEGATLVVCRGNAEKQFTLKAQNTGLPVVRITTVGFDRNDVEGDPVHQTVWRPAVDENGNFLDGKSASIVIENPDGSLDCEITTQIKGRGNATWGYPKRPYALKFTKKQKVLGMPKHKRWILLANWKDRTLLRNDAAFWLSKQSGLPYTVDGKFVELEFNGEHRGNYYLCEQIKIDEKRVNITEMNRLETGAEDPNAITGGYIMEIDNNWDDDNSFWSGQYPSDPNNPTGRKTDIGGFNFKYQFKEPDEEDRSNEAYYYMTKYIAELEEMIKKIPSGNRQYRDYFDNESAIHFMIVNELTSNGDFYNENWSADYKGPHSTYLYKDRDVINDDETVTVSKLHMGPVWDFDYLTFMPSRSNKWAGANQRNYYYYYLCQDQDFYNQMMQIWNDTKNNYTSLPSYITQMAKSIKMSAQFDGEMWWDTTEYGHKDQDQNGELNMTFDAAVDNIKSGFNSKWSFIDNNISKLGK